MEKSHKSKLLPIGREINWSRQCNHVFLQRVMGPWVVAPKYLVIGVELDVNFHLILGVFDVALVRFHTRY